MSYELKSLIGEYLDCGVAYSTDVRVRKEASSGGLISTLLITMFRKGFIDGALVVVNDGLEQRGVLAQTEDEILVAAGSKYLQIPLNTCLGEVVRTDGRFAIVGLPCHLKGLSKLESLYPKFREKFPLKIGLFCSHAVARNGMEFLLQQMAIKPEEVNDLKYRAKMRGTTGLYVKTLNGRERFIPSSKYFSKFFNFFFIPEGCMSCEDLTAECSDISVGDAWGLDETERLGLSLFITRSKAGDEALRLAVSEGFVEVRRVFPQVVVRSQKYLLVKKRRLMRGAKKVIGYTYHVAQVIGNFVSKNEKCSPLLRMWMRFLGIK